LIAYLALPVLAVAAAAWLWRKVSGWRWLALVWRWHSGAALDGQQRTNATWTKKGTEPLGRVPVVRWHHLPRLHRAGIRTGTTLALTLVLYGLIAAPQFTQAFLATAVVCALAAAVWRAYGKARSWRHDRDWVNPLNEALPQGVTVAELDRDRTRAVLALPAGASGTDRKQILQAVAAKLDQPLTDLVWSPTLHGKKPQVVITLAEPPPGYVSFADIRPLADAAEEHEIIFGLARKRAPGIISVDSDSPHLGLSMGSGDGKSVTARCAACQLAHHGALIVVLDTKYVSQHWAAGLPNVAYARTAEEIHNLALWLAAEVDRRKKLTLQHADVEGIVHANPGARIVAILEELNATQSELSAYWKESGGKGRSPAVTALDKVSFIGRQVLVNLLYIGQRLSAKATSGGSGDARENLGVLLMSNPAASTWKMLVGDRHALPPATDVRGRLQVVTAKTVTEVQGAYVTGAQAREYAMSGAVAVAPAGMPCVGGLAPLGTPERAAQDVTVTESLSPHGADLANVTDIRRIRPPVPRTTIADAVAEGITGPTVDAVRQALHRDPSSPRPVGRRRNADEYDQVELRDWEESRRNQERKPVR
jgi:hypothetical protein